MDHIEPSNGLAALRVLLVEDAAHDARLLERELERQGYEPQTLRVQSRAELEAALDRGGWDVLLCHQARPELDPLTTLACVADKGIDLPFIVVVSGHKGESLALTAMRAGAHDYVFKDRLGRLGAAIKRETREAAVREESRRMQQQLLLADRLSSVGMLAAGVAHEINNPLAYVLGNLEFALSHLDVPETRESAAEVIQALTHAQEGAERLRHTTRDLRVFCRTDDASETPVNVCKVLESSINMAWSEIRHRARLSRHFEPVPSIVGNENRLGQVFLNLLVNAAQSLPEGHSQEHEIAIDVRSDDDCVVIEVRDTGCGISEAHLKRLFEPFFTTKAPGVGSGIGLSVSRSIVADLGGQLTVESRLGEGSTFRVCLPAHDMVRSTRPPRLEPISVPRARILVIDDEPALCAVIRRLLGHQHDVQTFVDAQAALDLLRHDRDFDLIFCDMMMPRMSGPEFFGKLHEIDFELASRTVFLTGGAFHGPTRQFLSTVPNRVIEKPFDARSLQAAVAQVLEAHPCSGTWPLQEVRKAL